MRVLLTATMAASVLAIGLNIEPAQSRALGPTSASPETAVQMVQGQEIDRERVKARARQRIEQMDPADRQRLKRGVQQRLEGGSGYIDAARARARLRQRAGERIEEMGPAERLRAKRRVQQRLDERGVGYIERQRAKARVRERLEAR